MAITLPSGFKITVAEPVDNRIVLSKEEMLAVKRPAMPDVYICMCKDDGKLYIFNKTITPSETTGYFQPYEEVIDLPGAIASAMGTESGKAAMEEAVAQTLPGAMKDVLEDETLGEELVNNMFNNEHFELGLDNKIDISISVIQAIDSN